MAHCTQSRREPGHCCTAPTEPLRPRAECCQKILHRVPCGWLGRTPRGSSVLSPAASARAGGSKPRAGAEAEMPRQCRTSEPKETCSRTGSEKHHPQSDLIFFFPRGVPKVTLWIREQLNTSPELRTLRRTGSACAVLQAPSQGHSPGGRIDTTTQHLCEAHSRHSRPRSINRTTARRSDTTCLAH